MSRVLRDPKPSETKLKKLFACKINCTLILNNFKLIQCKKAINKFQLHTQTQLSLMAALFNYHNYSNIGFGKCKKVNNLNIAQIQLSLCTTEQSNIEKLCLDNGPFCFQRVCIICAQYLCQLWIDDLTAILKKSALPPVSENSEPEEKQFCTSNPSKETLVPSTPNIWASPEQCLNYSYRYIWKESQMSKHPQSNWGRAEKQGRTLNKLSTFVSF